MFLTLRQRRSTVGPRLHREDRNVSRGALLPHRSGLVSGRAGRSCGNGDRRLLWLQGAGSVSGRFTSFWLLHMRNATLPQWPRINPRVGRILRTRHSPVTQKTAPNVARLLGLPPMSLPRFAASDMGGLAECWLKRPQGRRLLHCNNFAGGYYDDGSIAYRTLMSPAWQRVASAFR